jgi:5-methylcytosine-specific restriction endonuclease McrA
MKQKLLTRNEFREAVFKRDGYCCVVCKKPAKDAHHIIERRLWDDGGYYLDNGVSLCEEHHLKAEMTILTCEELRDLAGIQKAIVPEHLYPDC